MPPKNASKSGATQGKKTEQKKKEKIIEDKTFGLKNKKGAKQQKFIQQVQHQVKFGGNKSQRQLEKEKDEQKSKKDDKKKELAEINALFKPVQQSASKGADPKSILCAFFKQGTCSKGNKCKFSHDLLVERRSEKRSIYVDVRDEAAENGEVGIFRAQTDIDRKKMDKQTEEISLEELIEHERAALGTNTTKVTLETFLAWKRKKLKDRKDKEKKDAEKKKNDLKSGREFGLSGREMFIFKPEMADNEGEMEEGDEHFDISKMEKDPESEDSDNIEYKELDYNLFIREYQIGEDSSIPNNIAEESTNGTMTEDSVDNGTTDGDVDIDEELFNEDDEDLEQLSKELEEIGVS